MLYYCQYCNQFTYYTYVVDDQKTSRISLETLLDSLLSRPSIASFQ